MLKLPGWENTSVYGSKTAGHILAGYNQKINTKAADLSGEYAEIYSSKNDGSLYYKAFEAEHAPHFVIFSTEIDLWDEKLDTDRTTPPEYVSDFVAGKSLIYIFKLNSDNKEYKVALVGAASMLPGGLEQEDIDILILCVPGSQYIKGYPKTYPLQFIEMLKPRFIMLSHYDDFFSPRENDFFDKRDKNVSTVLTSNFYGFIHDVQTYIANTTDYDRFESIIVPDVGAKMYFDN